MVTNLKVYFAGSIRGATFEGKEACYQAIIDAIRENGVLVSEHAAVTGETETLRDTDIHQRDIEWIDNSDFMIAEVSSPSHGVGYEIAYALYSSDMTILCLHKRGVKVSAMLTGNTNLFVEAYDTPVDAAILVRNFLAGNYFE